MTRTRVLRWGALVAFLGLFFMHGATASASEQHCGGSAVAGHVHSAGHTAHDAMAGMQGSGESGSSATLEASLGAPVSTPAGHVGDLCVAILLVGLFAFLIRGTRRTFTPITSSLTSPPVRLDEARPPPRPSPTMLSVWRN